MYIVYLYVLMTVENGSHRRCFNEQYVESHKENECASLCFVNVTILVLQLGHLINIKPEARTGSYNIYQSQLPSFLTRMRWSRYPNKMTNLVTTENQIRDLRRARRVPKCVMGAGDYIQDQTCWSLSFQILHLKKNPKKLTNETNP